MVTFDGIELPLKTCGRIEEKIKSIFYTFYAKTIRITINKLNDVTIPKQNRIVFQIKKDMMDE